MDEVKDTELLGGRKCNGLLVLPCQSGRLRQGSNSWPSTIRRYYPWEWSLECREQGEVGTSPECIDVLGLGILDKQKEICTELISLCYAEGWEEGRCKSEEIWEHMYMYN